MRKRRIIVAVTGASGAIYAQRVVSLLAEADCEVHLVVSKLGRRLLHDELGHDGLDLEALTDGRPEAVQVHSDGDVGAAPGSGSFVHEGMVIVPCSANTLGRIAGGMTENLVQRAASCTLKERRRLVICHRETPLSLIDIENMATVTRAGGIIAPMNPGFYLNPESIGDLVDYMAARVLDVLGVGHELDVHWDEHLGRS
ncbi:MAG: UbiX family flavin prenyltransferase [Planctomycetota bacterium]|nr:UbiX family flavin prenyltransferase [Planctomycetota bacterium]MEC9157050.1 UbiX family flavin prenyltransferase [Planctomycetota bacterium]MEC9232311.1 UbiX family flavin prenyltransferase [Planctomycetota bacterium]MED5507545.1 UbiX family flavin prenyltransferase [Planctomycetota bacterium]